MNNTANNAALAFANLRPEHILEPLEGLSFQCDGRFLALNSYENRVYQVGIEDSAPIVAKFYRPGRWNDDAIFEEHSFSKELADAELPVVAPLLLDGRTLHYAGPHRFAVYSCHGGRAPDLDNLDLLRQLGRLVARIHLIGEIRDFEHRPTVDIHSYGIASSEFLLDNDFIPWELRPAYESISDLVFTAIDGCYERAGAVQYLRLHADFHPGNVLVNSDRLHIVDLDDTRTGPAIQDLWMFMSGDQDEQSPQLDALLSGYTEFRHFDARELHLVEALRSLRIMHYAAWIARRWEDPAFKIAFPWFDSRRYWDEHVLALREQVALMQELPLVWHAD
ncbi:MAG: serine/threonine protein kinase [Gammaproteobacteria bacterium]|nr:serine/threonine protein kinase [Gammaproteobacteria bacterium]MDH3430640.1 serine/threonine protein kinase [Gammaproteobacteria bacterium]MDH3435122.1 serine/threonine protein kinase [Gammaproteobacteria bacterium]